MFNKIVDVLKEVFWLKKSPPKKRILSKSRKTSVKKRLIKRPKSVKKLPLKPKAIEVKSVVKKKSLQGPKIKVPKLPKAAVIDPNLVRVGEVTHYFERIKVCVVKITQGTILIGDRLTFGGKTSRYVQKVWSMQIESQDVKIARKGQMIGLKVEKAVGVGDIVYK